MPDFMDMELTNAAYNLMKELVQVKKGESVLVTIDSVAKFRVAEEIAKISNALGGKVMLAWHSTPKGYGSVTEPYLPEPLIACADKTDVWIELNDQWLLYSSMWDKAVANGRTRQVMLGGLSIQQIARCIGDIDIPAQRLFQDTITNMTRQTKHMKITNQAGTNIEFDNDPNRPVNSEIMYNTPGGHFLIGQIGWAPKEETVNGKIVIDGSISGGGTAELGVLANPVTYIVEKGRIVSIEGGKEADIIRNYFKELDDPNMYMPAHVCYGFNPNAKLEGTMTEDERVWGSTEWGFGHQGANFTGTVPRVAKSHIDGICLECSVWLDNVQITDNGRVIEPTLKTLSAKLGK